MKETTRSRLVVFAQVALVLASVGLYRWARHPRPADAAIAPLDPPAPVAVGPVSGDGRIQVALLLDTSGSMDGLIDQARSQLWKVVTRFDRARRSGKRPGLEIALYEYGNTARASGETGWIRRILPFTGDLDRVSEALFALDTSGGQEFVGQVLRAATHELAWSAAPGDLKLVFVAGNEPFTQGPVTPADAIEGARRKGIVVNVIHCGGDEPTWREGARLARTDFLSIDQNQAVVHIAAPQDEQIAQLGAALNQTYLSYGVEGKRGAERQARQDENARGAQAGSAVWRARAKSSASYRNADWDLGDALRDGKVKLEALENEELPEVMRSLSPEQRQAYVQKKLEERAGLQKQIRALSEARDTFVAGERKKQGQGAASLDTALIAAAEAQATAAGFRFE
jgi:hypothetical protein